MADFKSYLSKLQLSYQGSEEEKLCAEILFTDNDIRLGDKRLNNAAALTYNSTSCQKIFVLIEKGLTPNENPWKTIYKTLLLLHTIVLYGSELAIDKAIGLCRFVNPLLNYNSALVKRGYFSGGGTDYGAPVRQEAKVLDAILLTDESIRQARRDARNGQDSLVPMGENRSNSNTRSIAGGSNNDLLDLDTGSSQLVGELNPSAGQSMNYGQGLTTSVGAGYSLQAVPGLYEGRPERYFDNVNDRRIRNEAVKDAQITRDAQAPSLLDMAFDDEASGAGTSTGGSGITVAVSSQLPPADFLPALERQRELEQQLQSQQDQIRQLQELQEKQRQLEELQLQQQQLQQQQIQQQQQSTDLFGLMSAPPSMPVHVQQSPQQQIQSSSSSMPMPQQLPVYPPHSQQYPQQQQQQQQQPLPVYTQTQQPGGGMATYPPLHQQQHQQQLLQQHPQQGMYNSMYPNNIYPNNMYSQNGGMNQQYPPMSVQMQASIPVGLPNGAAAAGGGGALTPVPPTIGAAAATTGTGSSTPGPMMMMMHTQHSQPSPPYYPQMQQLQQQQPQNMMTLPTPAPAAAANAGNGTMMPAEAGVASVMQAGSKYIPDVFDATQVYDNGATAAQLPSTCSTTTTTTTTTTTVSGSAMMPSMTNMTATQPPPQPLPSMSSTLPLAPAPAPLMPPSVPVGSAPRGAPPPVPSRPPPGPPPPIPSKAP